MEILILVRWPLKIAVTPGSDILLYIIIPDDRLTKLYSETTWAVGIAQLTHHEVQGGGKNPETGGRGIFAPTANRVVS